MPNPTDETLRTKIAAVITSAAGLSVVFPYWVLGHEQNTWPGLLRSPNDLNAEGRGRVHGYVITRLQTTGEKRGNGCVRHTYTYLIQGFHYYYSGPNSNNSEKLLTAEIDAITDKFDKPQLLDPDLGRVDPISWAFDLKSIGGELMHIAKGQLTLQPCDVI